MHYHKIEKHSVANGTGIRVVLWCSGCRLYCKNCQNPSTWSFQSGQPFDENAKQELFEALDKSYIQGITFSGGHPLEPENVETVLNLIKEIKEKFPTKDIWLYTGYELSICNFTSKVRGIGEHDNHHNIMQEILSLCNVVIDGKFIEELKDLTLKWRGSSNQRVIDVKKSLESNNIVLYCD
jgi:anaerobic ribonucleoside-triphosphate reductase activating protein